MREKEQQGQTVRRGGAIQNQAERGMMKWKRGGSLEEVMETREVIDEQTHLWVNLIE